MAEAKAKTTGKASKDEAPQKSKAILQKYRDRISVLRQAQEYSQKDDIPRAVQYYMKYLDALAAFYEVEEKQLSPSMFDKERGITEILLVSQVYWDLSKAYDRHPKLHKESERCLDQFVKFSLGFKFQYINSEILRKFIRKNMAYNPKAFEVAYDRIRVNSKSCYIATYCYGEEHYKTEILREFKRFILNWRLGHKFVDYYYRFSPPFVYFCEENPYLGIPLRELFFRPVLSVFSKLVEIFIIK